MRLEIYGIDIRKIRKYQTSRKSMHWEPSCSMRSERRTDRRDEANSRFSQFWKRAKKVSQLRRAQFLKALVCSGRLKKNRASDFHARRSNTSFRRTEHIPTLWEFRCNKQRIGSTSMPVYIYRNSLLDSELHRNVQQIYDLLLIPLRIQSD